jgi:hypothetical protein
MRIKIIRLFGQYSHHKGQPYFTIRPFVQYLRQTDLAGTLKPPYLCREFLNNYKMKKTVLTVVALAIFGLMQSVAQNTSFGVIIVGILNS